MQFNEAHCFYCAGFVQMTIQRGKMNSFEPTAKNLQYISQIITYPC